MRISNVIQKASLLGVFVATAACSPTVIIPVTNNVTTGGGGGGGGTNLTPTSCAMTQQGSDVASPLGYNGTAPVMWKSASELLLSGSFGNTSHQWQGSYQMLSLSGNSVSQPAGAPASGAGGGIRRQSAVRDQNGVLVESYIVCAANVGASASCSHRIRKSTDLSVAGSVTWSADFVNRAFTAAHPEYYEYFYLIPPLSGDSQLYFMGYESTDGFWTDVGTKIRTVDVSGGALSAPVATLLPLDAGYFDFIGYLAFKSSQGTYFVAGEEWNSAYTSYRWVIRKGSSFANLNSYDLLPGGNTSDSVAFLEEGIDGALYLGINRSSGTPNYLGYGRVYKSTDQGANWSLIRDYSTVNSGTSQQRYRGFYQRADGVMILLSEFPHVVPSFGEKVTAGAEYSLDSGVTWQTLSHPLTDWYSLIPGQKSQRAWSADSSGNVYFASVGMNSVSTTNGAVRFWKISCQ